MSNERSTGISPEMQKTLTRTMLTFVTGQSRVAALMKPRDLEKAGQFMSTLRERIEGEGLQWLYVDLSAADEHPLSTVSRLIEAQLSADALQRLHRGSPYIRFCDGMYRWHDETPCRSVLVIDTIDDIYRFDDVIAVLSALKSALTVHGETMHGILLFERPEIAGLTFGMPEAPLAEFADLLNFRDA